MAAGCLCIARAGLHGERYGYARVPIGAKLNAFIRCGDLTVSLDRCIDLRY